MNQKGALPNTANHLGSSRSFSDKFLAFDGHDRCKFRYWSSHSRIHDRFNHRPNSFLRKTMLPQNWTGRREKGSRFM